MSARTPAQRDWVTHHSIRLGNLRPGKEYSLRAWSRNLEGGERFSDPLAICTLEVVKLYQPLPVPLATLTAPLKFGRDDQGLWGVLSGSGAETGTGVMSLPFHVIQPGPCSMWVRVHPGPDTALPTSMAVDGVAMDLDVSRSAINGSGWTWACVLPRGSAPAPLALRFESTEDHHVQFAGFGPDVLLSDILITTDSDYVPEDIMPIAVLLSPAGMDTPVLIRSLRRGWNLVANPFTTPTSFPGTSIPSAVTDITIDRLNGRPTDLRSISFDGVEWSGEIQLGFKQAVRIFNPSSSPIPLVLNGVEAKDATPTGFPAGERIFTPNRLRAGLLRDLLPGFSFRKGDGIRRVDRDTGETVRNSFNGETWTMIPTLNAGESVILDLVPR